MFLGWIPVAFAILAVRRRRENSGVCDARPRAFFVLIGIMALALSLGPLGGWGPYDLLTRVP